MTFVPVQKCRACGGGLWSHDDRARHQRECGSPVFRSRSELFRILDDYRRREDSGQSDAELSASIRADYFLPHNPAVRE